MNYLLLILLLLPACVKHVAPYTGSDIRTIRVAVVTDGTWPDEEIIDCIKDASSELRTYAGITLDIVAYYDNDFPKRNIDAYIPKGNHPPDLVDLNRMIHFLWDDTPKGLDGYDIAVGFRGGYLMDIPKFYIGFFTGIPFTIVQARTDDTWRRHIIMMQTDSQMLLHEIAHTLSVNHDKMSKIAFPIVDTGLGYVDRNRVFSNKRLNDGEDIVFEKK